MQHPSMTAKSAELMLATGKHYTAELLAAETGITKNQASSVIFNLRSAPRYEIESIATPRKMTTTRIISIAKRTVSLDVAELKNQTLWRLALGVSPREGD